MSGHSTSSHDGRTSRRSPAFDTPSQRLRQPAVHQVQDVDHPEGVVLPEPLRGLPSGRGETVAALPENEGLAPQPLHGPPHGIRQRARSVNTSLCTGCEVCAQICPRDAITFRPAVKSEA